MVIKQIKKEDKLINTLFYFFYNFFVYRYHIWLVGLFKKFIKSQPADITIFSL